MVPSVIDRVSGADLLNVALDAGTVPMQVGACLVLDADPRTDLDRIRRRIAARVPLIPRLRRRLTPAPPGCGRPVWIDDPTFDLDRHLTVRACPPPGDQDALFDLAAQVIGEPLPRSRPPWSMTLVTGLEPHRIGLIICFHHVLADGMGGLAALARFLDTDPASPLSPPARPFPRPAPSPRQMAVDAWMGRARALLRLPRLWTALRQGAGELGTPPKAARSSLNRPVGQRQRLAVVTADLQAVRRFAHAHGGTVNDAVLTAVTAALAGLLSSRGETVPELVVQIPVSARLPAGTTAETTGLGNRVGAMPLRLPTGGTRGERLERTAAIVRARMPDAPGASAGLLAAANRVLARLALLPWLLDHQHMINTVVTNLHGPTRRPVLGGATVQTMVAISLARGNVTTAFSALSCAGTLTVTIAADTRRVPDLAVLSAALEQELSAMR